MELTRFIKKSAFLWTLFFLIFCIVYPLGKVVTEAGGHAKGFFDPVVLAILKVTLTQALLSTVIASGVGLILGLKVGEGLVARPHSRIQILLIIPFVVPTLVVGITWLNWFGRKGLLAHAGLRVDWLYTFKAVILAHVFMNIPWVAFNIAQARKYLPLRQIEAACLLGSNSWQRFLAIIWPQVRGAGLASAAQVFSFCSMSFALVMILGGGPPVQTLETELYGRVRYQTLSFFGDLSGAAVCAIWEALLTFLPWILILFWTQSRRWKSNISTEGKLGVPLPFSKQKKWMWRLLMVISFVFVIPYLSIFSGGIFASLLTLNGWSQIQKPFFVSTGLALFTSLGTVFTALMAIFALQSLKKWARLQFWFNLFLNVPSGISVLVISLGMWMAYSQWLDPFEGGWIHFVMMGLVQMTLFFPIAFRVLWPLREGFQKGPWEAALLLGNSEVQAFWKIELPRWKGPLLGALAVVAGLALGEVSAISFFYTENWVPLPLMISRWMQVYRFEEAQQGAAFLFLLSVLLIISSFEIGYRVSKYDAFSSR